MLEHKNSMSIYDASLVAAEGVVILIHVSMLGIFADDKGSESL